MIQFQSNIDKMLHYQVTHLEKKAGQESLLALLHVLESSEGAVDSCGRRMTGV